MREVPQQVSSWLYNVIQPQYINKQITYTHVIRFLQNHLYGEERFRIRTLIYTSAENGNEALLLNLSGTMIILPEFFVPIQIWLPHLYPYDEGIPIVYVTPDVTQGWHLVPGNHVDGLGRFYHPYLTDWYSQSCSHNVDFQRVYNILGLMGVMRGVFSKELPMVYRAAIQQPSSAVNSPRASPPPPKPAKIKADDAPEKSQPSLDDQKLDSSVPFKYQTPLPLPHELSANSYGGRRMHDQGNRTYQPPNTTFPLLPKATETADIIDDRNTKEINPKVGVGEADRFQAGLQRALQGALENSPDIAIISKANENTNKISALRTQLSHHRQQATANRQNLSHHVEYLTEKVNQISQSNSGLEKLDKLNFALLKKVFLGPSTSLLLDETVMADLPLVSQLYDTVAEIKATKDVLNLICGNYKSTKELVSDDNLEKSIKNARSLGRDLFWLELTKQEITNIAGIN